MTDSSNETADTSGIADLSASEEYSLLAADRRRQALDILAGRTTPVELRELAAGIAAREGGIDAVDEKTIERVAITLHHTHLPKMVDIGVLDYDPEAHRIDPDRVPPRLGTDQPFPQQTRWFAAFADQHRRFVLEYLTETERTTVEELSNELAGEDTRAVDAPAKRIAIRLHHNHLPRLDDMGFVHYDPDDHTIEATERITGQVVDLLDNA